VSEYGLQLREMPDAGTPHVRRGGAAVPRYVSTRGAVESVRRHRRDASCSFWNAARQPWSIEGSQSSAPRPALSVDEPRRWRSTTSWSTSPLSVQGGDVVSLREKAKKQTRIQAA